MNRALLYFLASLISLGCNSNIQEDNTTLQVSKNGRFLERKNGKPFFYLGDTAWELFHKLDREEATEYLENRAEKGFTVIKAVVLAELDGLRTPNSYGELPLIDLDPTRPNEKYFEHVDFIVNKAAELGLFVGMLPTWGDKIPNEIGGEGPVVFDPENAKVFGEFLGKRYKDKPVIWILGGDRNIDSDTALGIWRALAEGLRLGDEGRHLISYHPRGAKTSSYWLHNEDWLDFNMYQSSHAHHFHKVYEYATHDYLLQPVKPTVEAEPAYEDIPLEFWIFMGWQTDSVVRARVLDTELLIKDRSFYEKGYFTDYDVRVHAYWNLLSGACGYTYGNNAIWQMFKGKDSYLAIPCLYDWRESLDRPGATQIKYIRALFESYDFSKLIPDESVIFGFNEKNNEHIRAAVASDRGFLLVDLPRGKPVTVVIKKISAPRVRAWWYNPKNGEVTLIGEDENQGHKTFTPPSTGIGNDWILVIEDSGKSYKISM